MRRTRLLATAAALAAGAAAAAFLAGRGDSPERSSTLDGRISGARADVVVGISDQRADFLRDPRFRALGVRHVRLVLPWDAPLVAPADVDRWLRAARGAGVEVLLSFSHISGEECPAAPCTAPRPSKLGRAFEVIRERWPWVREFATWNEPNHPTQPLRDRPELLARYYRELRARCAECTLLAADFVADGDPAQYVRRFTGALGEAPRLWGMHNYADANRFRAADTRRFLDLVRGEVWVTESGGIVELGAGGADPAFERDERRAERAVRQLARLARLDPRITRVYVYQWRKTNPNDRFDSGLTRLDGTARPSLRALRAEIAR